MSTENTQSKACCNTPAVVGKDYSPKGDYIQVGGLKTYATGSKDTKLGVLLIYDIFGFYNQTLQGADILAYTDDKHPYQVFIPDFFEGEAADLAWYPPKNPEQEKLIGDFFKTKAALPKAVPRIPKLIEELSKSRGIDTWAVVGFCWGGKVTNLSSMEGTPFKVAAVCHPAMVTEDDAPGIVIPYLMLLSKDEDEESVKKWQSGVKVPHAVEWFPDNKHGWMSARSNLANESEKKAYERGYSRVLEFLGEHI